MLADGIRALGTFHRLSHDIALRHAAPHNGHRCRAAHVRGFSPATGGDELAQHPLDVLVHAQDIAIPLGRDYPMPPEAARAGADRVWTMGWPFWARRRLRGLRLLATDTDWSAGAGAELRGPIGVLLLLLTARTTMALPQLSGPGVRTVTERSVIPHAEAD